jgi:hypothetical protein
MIDKVLNFFQNQLEDYLNPDPNDIAIKVDFINLGTDPPGFPATINILLINLEEETQLRPPNRYLFTHENGQQLPAQPPLRLTLHLLFAAKTVSSENSSASTYTEAIKQLSKVILFFQSHPLFEPDQNPDMAEEGIPELAIEFLPLSYAQQNEIWGSLKRSFLPSVCFKVKMVIIQEKPAMMEGEVEQIDLKLRQP